MATRDVPNAAVQFGWSECGFRNEIVSSGRRMKKTIFCITWSVMILVAANSGPQMFAQAKIPLLVSTSWLEGHLHDSSLILLHYGQKEEFEKEHIPKARLVSLKKLVIDVENGLRHEMPSDKTIESVFKLWGIDNDSRIVISYGDENAFVMVARLFVTLDYAGLGEQISILSGGFPVWKREHRAVTSEMTKYAQGSFQIRKNVNVVADKNWILGHLTDPEILLIDARPETQYDGSEEDHNSPRRGHIEGALNIPFFQIQLDDTPYMIKSQAELQQLFDDNEVRKGKTVVAYCGSGIWAASIYFAARLLGYQARFYDGSLQEWGNDKTLPMTLPVGGNQ